MIPTTDPQGVDAKTRANGYNEGFLSTVYSKVRTMLLVVLVVLVVLVLVLVLVVLVVLVLVLVLAMLALRAF